MKRAETKDEMRDRMCKAMMERDDKSAIMRRFEARHNMQYAAESLEEKLSVQINKSMGSLENEQSKADYQT